MNPTALLAFSGGLDSTTCAILLKNAEFTVTLAYVDWEVEDSSFSSLQRTAAYAIASHLNLPILELAHVKIPQQRHSRWAWVQTVAPMVLYEAATPATYPVQPDDFHSNYDVVAFGMQGTSGYFGGDIWWDVTPNRTMIEGCVRGTNYRGRVIFPMDMFPSRESIWTTIPDDIKPLIWSCNFPNDDGTPCDKDECHKCGVDRFARSST